MFKKKTLSFVDILLGVLRAINVSPHFPLSSKKSKGKKTITFHE